MPSTHMRCRITAILRARATFARFEPRRLATSIPQRLSFENRVMRANSVEQFSRIEGGAAIRSRPERGKKWSAIDIEDWRCA